MDVNTSASAFPVMMSQKKLFQRRSRGERRKHTQNKNKTKTEKGHWISQWGRVQGCVFAATCTELSDWTYWQVSSVASSRGNRIFFRSQCFALGGVGSWGGGEEGGFHGVNIWLTNLVFFHTHFVTSAIVYAFINTPDILCFVVVPLKCIPSAFRGL